MVRPGRLPEEAAVVIVIGMGLLAICILCLVIPADRARARRKVEETGGSVIRVRWDRWGGLESVFCGPVTYWLVEYSDHDGRRRHAKCRCTFLRCTFIEDEADAGTS